MPTPWFWGTAHVVWFPWDIDMPGIGWFTLAIAVGTVVSAVVLLATAILARGALGDAQKTRHGQLVLELARRWNEPRVIASLTAMGEVWNEQILGLVDKLYGTNQPAPTEDELAIFSALQAVPELIEMIGVLAYEKVISIPVIDRMWGSRIINTWTAWHDAAHKLREHSHYPHNYEYFEWLADELLKHRQASVTASAVGGRDFQAAAPGAEHRIAQSQGTSALQSNERNAPQDTRLVVKALLGLIALSALRRLIERVNRS